jgi:hypothetical protein
LGRVGIRGEQKGTQNFCKVTYRKEPLRRSWPTWKNNNKMVRETTGYMACTGLVCRPGKRIWYGNLLRPGLSEDQIPVRQNTP